MANTPIGYFFNAFGINADDAAPIPVTGTNSGPVNYNWGWTDPYEYNILTNPSALPIPRGAMNQLMLDITAQLQQYSQYGAPFFITTAQNQGTPFAYPIYAQVYHSGNVYRNTVAGNVTTPPDPSWLLISQSAGAGLVDVVVLTSGAGTYTPTAGTTSIMVEVVGGGGGGGNGSTAANGGGGAGGYAKLWIPTVATSYAYSVAASAASATNGNTTTFGGSLSATGGLAGTVPGSGLGCARGGAGGTGVGGDINIVGGPGGNGSYPGSSGQSNVTGNGWSSFFGGGAASISTINANGAGISATGYGGGGSGSALSGGGGAGAGGVIYITEYA